MAEENRDGERARVEREGTLRGREDLDRRERKGRREGQKMGWGQDEKQQIICWKPESCRCSCGAGTCTDYVQLQPL